MLFKQQKLKRGRQLQVARQTPTLVQTGQQLEQLTRQAQLAPFQNLQQYAGIVSPLASGFPTTSTQQQFTPNPFTTGLGGAAIGYGLGGTSGAILGGLGGVLGGLL